MFYMNLDYFTLLKVFKYVAFIQQNNRYTFIYIYIYIYISDVSLINFIVNSSNFLNKTLMSSDETRRMIKDSHFERKLYLVIL